MAAAATERKLARNKRLAAARNRATSHDSIPNALTIRLPVTVSCRRFCTSANWSCPRRVVVRTRRPMRTADKTMNGTNSSSTHASPRPSTTTAANKDETEQLLQELRQYTRHRVLHPLNVVDDGRDQRPGGVFLKKGRRPAQHRV